MEEYTIVYKEGLAKGLRASEYNPVNEGALTEATGVFIESKRLNQIPELDTFDVSTLEVMDFPFPQCFQLRNHTLICTPTRIYTYLAGTLTLAYTALEGSTWTVADFFNFLVLTNGRELITLDPETGAWSKYLDCLIPYCLCVCDLNGQLFVGGPEVSISAGWLGD